MDALLGLAYHYNYAVLISQQGDNEQAVRHLEQALEIEPQNRNARVALERLRGNR